MGQVTAPERSPAVEAMLTDNQAPTAPLSEFLAAYRQDDNLWWRLACGHHQNLLDEAIELLVEGGLL